MSRTYSNNKKTSRIYGLKLLLIRRWIAQKRRWTTSDLVAAGLAASNYWATRYMQCLRRRNEIAVVKHGSQGRHDSTPAVWRLGPSWGQVVVRAPSDEMAVNLNHAGAC